jgi:MEDS: MEthanogen/methylotroph, DcmR Sensory domain
VLGETRRNELHRRLHARGLDLDLAVREHRFLSLDVAETLSGFMVDGWPDEGRFWKAGTSLVLGAARASNERHPAIAACGDGTATLLAGGNAAAAIRLEHLWDEFARTYDVEILCGYAMKVPHDDEDEDIDVYRRICLEHSAVHSR